MNYSDFCENLKLAGLSIREFGELVCTNPNTFTNCRKTGHVPEHWGIVVTLMARMEAAGLDFRPVLRSMALKPRKSRGAAAAGKFGGDRQQSLDLKPGQTGDENDEKC